MCIAGGKTKDISTSGKLISQFNVLNCKGKEMELKVKQTSEIFIPLYHGEERSIMHVFKILVIRMAMKRISLYQLISYFLDKNVNVL